MSEEKKPEYEVSLSNFIQELEKEYRYHSEGSTSYRKSTVEFSLQVVHKVGEVFPFLNQKSAKQTVFRLLPHLDIDKKEDIAKCLYTVAKDLHLKAHLPDEIKSYIQQKRQQRKSLKRKEPL